MSHPNWRKNNVRSSIQQACIPQAAERNGRTIITAVTLGALISFSALAQAETDTLEKVVRFDIPQQRADISLTEFAKQANITLIFPFDDVKQLQTNSLQGEYSITDAVALLLRDTQLFVNIGADGQLTILMEHDLGEIDSMHKKKLLSSAVIAALSSLTGANAIAQQTSAPAGQVEEVLVTGIRASLQRAMDVKRESGGVVDAISSEDIGKFPDTNLAESLQRITGVSDRKSVV